MIQFHKTPISPTGHIGLKQKFIAGLTISSRTNLYHFWNKADFSRPCKLIWINAMMKIMLIIHQKAVIHHPPGYSKYRNIFQNLFFNNLHPISFIKYVKPNFKNFFITAHFCAKFSRAEARPESIWTHPYNNV